MAHTGYADNITFIDYLGKEQTVTMNDILYFKTKNTPPVTGRISGVCDGYVNIWWTNNYSNNKFIVTELFTQEHIQLHYITKTTTIILHEKNGTDTTAQLGENLKQILENK